MNTMMTPAQRADFDRLRDQADGLCACGSAGSGLCSRKHTGACTGAATEPLMDASGHVTAAICRACKAGQLATPAKVNRRAKTERARVWAAAQTSIFDLADDEGAQS